MKKLFIRKNKSLPLHIKNLQSIYQLIEIGHEQVLESGNLLFDNYLYYLPILKNYKPFKIDLDSYWNKISKQKNLKTDLLVKALKDCSKGEVIVEACAGSLKDALFLIKFGYKVVSFEKNRIIYDLLVDALFNLDNLISSQIILSYGDFIKFNNEQNYSYCYLDPMFSHDRKALPKKEMVLFKEIIENTQNYNNDSNSKKQNLLEHCLNLSLKKIIVKRADKSDFLENKKPSYNILGKTIRLDIYKNNY